MQISHENQPRVCSPVHTGKAVCAMRDRPAEWVAKVPAQGVRIARWKIILTRGQVRFIMSRKKQKHLKQAVPVAGVVGVSMALAGGASAAGTVGTATDVRDTARAPEINFNEEELADVSLGTFFVFDKEDVA